MKKIFFSFFSLLLAPCFAFSQGVWTQKADIPQPIPRYGAVGFAIGTKGYVGAMSDFGGGNYDFWEWNQAANTWTQKNSFTNATRTYPVSFTIGNKGYTGTGTDPSPPLVNDFWEYDPINDIWSQKANFPGTPRVSSSGFSIDSLGYLGLGIDSGGLYTTDFWQYSPATNSWKSLANFPGCPRFRSLGVSIAGKGYIFFGQDTCTFGSLNSEVWKYDPISDSWSQKANLPAQARYMPSGFAIGDTGYIGTGYTGSVPLAAKDFWKYLPSTDTWVQMADFGGGYRSAAVGFSIGNYGYISTGDDGSTGTWDLWEFSPGPVSVNEIEHTIESRIFPNPFVENAILEIFNLKNVQIEKGEIKIFSSDGKDVTNIFFIKQKNKYEFIIENKSSCVGIFFYKVKTSGNYTINGKFITRN